MKIEFMFLIIDVNVFVALSILTTLVSMYAIKKSYESRKSVNEIRLRQGSYIPTA